MKDENGFKPFIPADKVVPEVTAVSVILGILLAVLFGAANAYLGLRVGMTVSASIPAAVISMGVIRVILRRDSILENNMVQTIGSAGESVAAGAIFTLPALFMWMRDWGEGAPSLVEIALIALCGGVLGVLFMIPLRQALIVKEHGVLPYPEGQACAEVLIAGEQGGSKAGVVFAGMLSGQSGIGYTAAIALAIGIAIQNFPEGAIISMPLKSEGESKGKACWLGILSGAVEPVAAAITIAAADIIVPALPYLLSFAAGAMMYVVIEELIPEMSQGKHSNIGTILFAFGFTVMMMLDVAFG